MNSYLPSIPPACRLLGSPLELLGEETRKLLSRLAWLSPAPIPENLLEEPIAGEAANPAEAFDALAELEGLLLLNRSGETPQFSVNRLLQGVTRLRQELAQEPHALEAALAWINAAFVGDPQDVRSWPVLEPLEPHAKAVANFAAGAGVAGVTARLLSQMGILLFTKAAYGEAEPMYHRSLKILLSFKKQGYQHLKLEAGNNNYIGILQAQGLPKETIQAKLASLSQQN